MCDSETKRRFLKIDGAIASLTNDLNQNNKEIFKRLGKLETGYAVLATKMDSIIDTVTNLNDTLNNHIKAEEVILKNEQKQITGIKEQINKAKFMIAGGALMLSVIWAGAVAIGTAVWQWIKHS